jgi:hypothetical protein
MLHGTRSAGTVSGVDQGEHTPEWLTAAWLSEVLGGQVGGVTATRIGDGLVGMNLRLQLLDADPSLPASVVAKLPSPDPTSRATGIALRNYEREVRFYLHVAPTVDIRVPTCHHGHWDVVTGDFVLLLEDMAPAEQGDQIAGCSVERARATVVELARLHGPRWADPTLDEIDWLSRREADGGAQLAALWQMVVPGFRAVFGRHLDTSSTELLDRFEPELARWVDGHEAPFAVTHGDFRLDNLLFGTSAGGPPVTAVDWQTPGHGSPVVDLSYFLGAGLLPEDRRAHERALVELYGATLTGEYGVDVDETWLWDQYRRGSFAGAVMAVIASQIVATSDRSEAMFTAMATRHLWQAADLDALSLI